MPAPGSRPSGISPSAGSGIGGSTLLRRVVKSLPRQTRSSPTSSTACSRWSTTRSSVRSIVPDRDRVEHEAEEPARVRESAELVVREVAGVVVDGPAGGVRADHRGTAGPGDDLGERRRRRVGEVEDHAEPDERVDERAPEAGEATVLDGTVGERVAAVPRQPGHAHPELPERLGGPDLVAELLDALERQHQADPLASRDGLEVGRRPDLEHAVGALAGGPQETGRLAECLAQGALRLALELDEDRAHLQADAAGLEQRQPRAREGAASRRSGARGSRARAAGRGGRPRSRGSLRGGRGAARMSRPSGHRMLTSRPALVCAMAIQNCIDYRPG